MKANDNAEHVIISTNVDLIIYVIIFVLGTTINCKYLKDMKDDDRNRPPGTNPSLILPIMTTKTKMLIVWTPFYFFLYWFLNQGLDLPDWFRYALCYDQYIATTVRFYFALNSLTIATMRYVFIVHNGKVLRWGKDFVKKMFYIFHFVVPLLMGLLHSCTLPVPLNVQNIAQKTCNGFYQESLNITCGDSEGIRDECSPLLTLVQEYISTDVTKGVGIAVKILSMFMFINVLDGIMYWKTFGMIKASQGKNFLKDALSEDQLRFRRKQLRVNIKVTFLSWIIETTAGIALVITWLFASERSIHLFRTFIILVAFVFTPSTYILNRETTKQIIILENWFEGLQAISLPFQQAQDVVERLQRQELDEERNRRLANRRSRN